MWLAYSDLFAGMLIVFAVFYGMQLEQERAAKKELQQAQNKAIRLLDTVAANINAKYKGTSKEVRSDGTQLIIPADLTFASSKFTIKDESKKWLLEIAGELQKALLDLGSEFKSVTIEIRGHTDAYPVTRSQLLPTNWELSSRRATELVRLFQENMLLDPSKFQVVAVGAAEFDQLQNNFDSEGHLRPSEELEGLRKIQIRIVPNYNDLLKGLSMTTTGDSVKSQDAAK
jgi:chemotaxis protein MotB